MIVKPQTEVSSQSGMLRERGSEDSSENKARRGSWQMAEAFCGKEVQNHPRKARARGRRFEEGIGQRMS